MIFILFTNSFMKKISSKIYEYTQVFHRSIPKNNFETVILVERGLVPGDAVVEDIRRAGMFGADHRLSVPRP